ncbi:hypothetical protein Ocin01_18484 [Orchesella cincta]|uniref:Secreted protein n=1 Tax=Orchesella cincta TaxID=48709 RepID=A0A1D2M5D7_ORCCI|nr:hypothetical protein Ocin01_18484 [Orchesella cincta]
MLLCLTLILARIPTWTSSNCQHRRSLYWLGSPTQENWKRCLSVFKAVHNQSGRRVHSRLNLKMDIGEYLQVNWSRGWSDNPAENARWLVGFVSFFNSLTSERL